MNDILTLINDLKNLISVLLAFDRFAHFEPVAVHHFDFVQLAQLRQVELVPLF
jgi:hypothetical protein